MTTPHHPSTAPYWLATLAIATVFALVQQLDITPPTISDLEAAQAVAEEAEALASRDYAARTTCGPEASFRWVSDTDLQCLDKHGRKTGKPQAVTVAGVLP